MPTYEVRLTTPALASVTIEVSDELVARATAAEMFAEWARSLAADDFAAKRQPMRPDDTEDARSEARSEWTEGDVADDAAEAFRWGFTADGREPEEGGREQ